MCADRGQQGALVRVESQTRPYRDTCAGRDHTGRQLRSACRHTPYCARRHRHVQTSTNACCRSHVVLTPRLAGTPGRELLDEGRGPGSCFTCVGVPPRLWPARGVDYDRSLRPPSNAFQPARLAGSWLAGAITR
jgi:hypothetical protein